MAEDAAGARGGWAHHELDVAPRTPPLIRDDVVAAVNLDNERISWARPSSVSLESAAKRFASGPEESEEFLFGEGCTLELGVEVRGSPGGMGTPALEGTSARVGVARGRGARRGSALLRGGARGTRARGARAAVSDPERGAAAGPRDEGWVRGAGLDEALDATEAEPAWYEGEPAAPPAADKTPPLQSLVETYTSWKAIETLNGRTAMLGIFADYVVELQTGLPALQQEKVRWAWVSLTIATVLLGSLAPKLRGYNGADGLTKEPEDYYVFTAEAEQLLGRAAMLGFVFTVILEQLEGGLSILRPIAY